MDHQSSEQPTKKEGSAASQNEESQFERVQARDMSVQGARGVSFSSSEDEVIEIRTLDEYTEEEISNKWFSYEELKDTLESMDKTVRKIDRRKKHDQCTRGLEHYTAEGRNKRHQNKSDSIQAVLQKQDFQQASEASDPEIISRVYAKKTFDSRVEARLAGMKDESEAMD